MNETVLDVLMYLFENFSDQDYEQSPIKWFCGKNCCKPGSVSGK